MSTVSCYRPRVGGESVDEERAGAVLAQVACAAAEEFRRYPEVAVPLMLRQVPTLASAAVTAEMFDAVIREHAEGVLRLMLTPIPRDSIRPAGYTASFARACARLGVPAAAVLRGYQHGHELVWHWWSGQVARRVTDAHTQAAVTARLAELLMAYVSEGMSLTVEVHAAETAQQTLGASWRRRNTVLEIVENRTRHTIGELSTILGHDLSQWHLGFVAWSSRDEAADWSYLEAECRRRAVRATGHRPLLIGVDDRAIWGWCSHSSAALRWVDDPDLGERLRFAVGRPGSGLEGFRITHREAMLTRSLASSVTGPVLRYADLSTVALLREEQDLRRRYVEVALGALAGPGHREHTLRETVRIYLREGENMRAAARSLHLHRNTMQQRLDQAATLRGRPLAEDRLTLAVALEMLTHGAIRQPGTVRGSVP